MQKQTSDWSEFSKKGGDTTKARHGRDHYSRIGKKGAETKKKDPDFYKKLSQAGIEARRRKKEQQTQSKTNPIQRITSVLTGSK